MPKIDSEEFRATALELLDFGMTQHGFEPSETVEGRTEQTRILNRIREFGQGNKVLREAAAHFSQANLKIGQARPNDALLISHIFDETAPTLWRGAPVGWPSS